jgi:hypothetical protein
VGQAVLNSGVISLGSSVRVRLLHPLTKCFSSSGCSSTTMAFTRMSRVLVDVVVGVVGAGVRALAKKGRPRRERARRKTAELSLLVGDRGTRRTCW